MLIFDSYMQKARNTPASEMYLLDSETGRKLPAHFFVPTAVLAISDSVNTKRFLHEVTEMDKMVQEYEVAGTYFDKLFYTDPAPRGKQYTAYKSKVRQGQAKLLSRSATSWPQSNSQYTAHLAPISPIGLAYNINYFDQEEASMLGQNIDQEGLIDAVTGIWEGIDNTAHFGGVDEEGQILQGWLDFLNGGTDEAIAAGTSFYKVTLENGALSSPLFSQKTGQEIFKDVNKLLWAVFVNNKGKRLANKLALGLLTWQTMCTKLLFDEENGINIPMTVDQALKKANPQVNWVIDPFLDAINHPVVTGETWDGAEGSGAMAAYNDSRDNYKLIADTPQTLTPFKHEGFNTEVKVFGMVSSFMPKKLTDLAYYKGVR